MTRRSGGFRGAKPTWTTTSTSGVFGMKDVVDLKAANQWPRGPVAPTSLAGTGGDGQVELTWTAPATTHGTITDYVVEYTPAAGSPTVVATGSTAASYTLAGLTNDTEYTFRVAAVNHTRGDWSDSVAVTPLAPPVSNAPTNFAVSTGAEQAYLSWDAPSEPNGTISEYKLEISAASVPAYFVTLPANYSDATIAGLTNGTEYQFRLAAVTENGNGEWSAPVIETTDAAVLTITQQPVGPFSSGGAASFGVTVSLSVAPNISVYIAYQWQKQTGGVGNFIDVGEQTAFGSATSNILTLTGITGDDDGDVYRVVVSATNGTADVTSESAVLTVPSNSEPAPILLVQTQSLDGDGDVVLGKLIDQSANNYWVDADTYDGGEIFAGDNTPLYAANVVSPVNMAAGSFQVGYNGWSSATLGLRTNYDYALNVANRHFDNQIGNGPFTIEMFYRPGDTLQNTYGSGEEYFRIGNFVVAGFGYDEYYSNEYGLPASDYIGIYEGFAYQGNELAISTTTLPVGVWSHIAFVVYANEARLYINGTLACTYSGTVAPVSYATFRIGNSSPFASHFEGLRVVGAAIYSGQTITVPSDYFPAPARAANPTTELLLKAAHGLEDWSRHRHSLFGSYGYYGQQPPQASVRGDQKKFGAASYAFGYDGWRTRGLELNSWFYAGNSSQEYFYILQSVLGGDSAWTIEMFVRPTGSIAYSSGLTSYQQDDGECYIAFPFGNAWIMLYDNTLSPDGTTEIAGGLRLEFMDYNAGVAHSVTAASLPRDAWSHIAIVAEPNVNGVVESLRLKVNGTDAGAIDVTQLWGNKGSVQYLPMYGETNSFLYTLWHGPFKGHMDDIRISSAALYGTGSYTVPTESLT